MEGHDQVVNLGLALQRGSRFIHKRSIGAGSRLGVGVQLVSRVPRQVVATHLLAAFSAVGRSIKLVHRAAGHLPVGDNVAHVALLELLTADAEERLHTVVRLDESLAAGEGISVPQRNLIGQFSGQEILRVLARRQGLPRRPREFGQLPLLSLGLSGAEEKAESHQTADAQHRHGDQKSQHLGLVGNRRARGLVVCIVHRMCYLISIGVSNLGL